MNDTFGVQLMGHLKIHSPETGEIYLNKRNAIHYEAMSISLAEGLSNQGTGFISEMCFGNGGTFVDETGIITYLTPNTSGLNASLYNQTYQKVVDQRSINNTDSARNRMEVRHVSGMTYTDILVTCLLDYGEPDGQLAFDNATAANDAFVFDELGLRAFSPEGQGRLLTHVIFHPIQKALNRLIQVDYTVRIQSLAG